MRITLILLIICVIVLALLCLAQAGWGAVLKRGLRQAKEQIRAQTANETTARLSIPCPNAAAEELFQAVNGLLEQRQQELSDYRKKEQDLRRQIANVSHDLRTPLTSILGYLQLLKQKDLTLDKRREYLSVIEGRARILQSFISSFYDLSRIEGGEWPLELEWVDLSRTLSDQLAIAYEQLEQAGLCVEVDAAPSLPSVRADQGAVTRLFSNLLTNALRHGTGPLSIRLYREGGQIVSAFSNRAADMTAEDAAHVFERFYTADKMRSGQDTGLGLAIVKALAERMGHRAAARWDSGIFTVEIIWQIK